MSNQQIEPTLIPCPACNAQVSNQARACPKCGQPISPASGRADNQRTGVPFASLPFQQFQPEPQKIRNPRLVGCVVVILALTLIGTIAQIFTGKLMDGGNKNSSVANVTPSRGASSASDPNVAERVRQGAQLFEKIKSSPPNPLVTGVGMEYPALTTLVRKDRWDRLSKREQVDLTYYAESLVQDARSNPAKYSVIPPSAPSYPLYEKKVRDLCAECWAVGITYPSPDVRGEDTFDRIVLGDTAWEQNKSGSRASEFRQQR